MGITLECSLYFPILFLTESTISCFMWKKKCDSLPKSFVVSAILFIHIFCKFFFSFLLGEINNSFSAAFRVFSFPLFDFLNSLFLNLALVMIALERSLFMNWERGSFFLAKCLLIKNTDTNSWKFFKCICIDVFLGKFQNKFILMSLLIWKWLILIII